MRDHGRLSQLCCRGNRGRGLEWCVVEESIRRIVARSRVADPRETFAFAAGRCTVRYAREATARAHMHVGPQHA